MGGGFTPGHAARVVPIDRRCLPLTVLVVGCGYAGRRFASALRHLEEDEPGLVRLAGACDADEDAHGALGGEAPVFHDVVTALSAVRPDAVVVAVNEQMHFDVLQRVAEQPPLLVMCEKPLTATLAEAESLPARVRETVTINFVERQSEILGVYEEWARSRPGLRPLRVEFFWGKHRVADPRPTMGVLSEITHPLDLVDFVFGFERFSVLRATAVTSNYSPHHDASMESIDFVAQTEDFPLVGHVSFAWPRRHRTVTAVLADDTGALFRATMDFDKPRWDCDHLDVVRIDTSTGARHPQLQHSTDVEVIPPGLRGIAKVARFVRSSVAAARGAHPGPALVRYDQALKVQRLLHTLAVATEDGLAHVDLLPREGRAGLGNDRVPAATHADGD